MVRGLAPLSDFGVDRDGPARPYLIMEYLQGQTLEDRLRTGALPPDAALPVFEAIGAAIEHAHQHGVLYLDLKPANVLLVEDLDGGASPKMLISAWRSS
jgi:eukaryotic-like serine/threonine-protein kinase